MAERDHMVSQQPIREWRYPPPQQSEPAWPVQATVLGAIALQVLLPARVTAGPKWLLPALEGALLVTLVMTTPRELEGPHARRRRLALAVIALVSVANAVSFVLLVVADR